MNLRVWLGDIHAKLRGGRVDARLAKRDGLSCCYILRLSTALFGYLERWNEPCAPPPTHFARIPHNIFTKSPRRPTPLLFGHRITGLEQNIRRWRQILACYRSCCSQCWSLLGQRVLRPCLGPIISAVLSTWDMPKDRTSEQGRLLR